MRPFFLTILTVDEAKVRGFLRDSLRQPLRQPPMGRGRRHAELAGRLPDRQAPDGREDALRDAFLRPSEARAITPGSGQSRATRSAILAFSNSARAASTWSCSLPAGVVQSIPSPRLTNDTPCDGRTTSGRSARGGSGSTRRAARGTTSGPPSGGRGARRLPRGGRARRADGGALPERRPGGAAADGPDALAASRPGHDQAAGGGGGIQQCAASCQGGGSIGPCRPRNYVNRWRPTSWTECGPRPLRFSNAWWWIS